MRGFMDGHTQWMSSDDEDDHEEVVGAAAGNEEEGQQDNNDTNTRTPLTSVVGTLMFKNCFSRRRLTPEVLLERNLSWRNWR